MEQKKPQVGIFSQMCLTDRDNALTWRTVRFRVRMKVRFRVRVRPLFLLRESRAFNPLHGEFMVKSALNPRDSRINVPAQCDFYHLNFPQSDVHA